MKVIGGLVAALLAAALVVLPGGGTAAGQDGEKVVLTIGMVQGIDSMNPCAASPSPRYEAWNMQYATLTDKAAKDFATDPRPRRVVEGLRRTARRGPTRCGRT